MSKSAEQPIGFLVLWAAIGFSSIAFFQEHTGWAGTIVYLAVIGVLLALLYRFQNPIFRFVEAAYRPLLVLMLAALVLVFAVVYPLETSGAFSLGSDRDEMVNLAVRSLAGGGNPYLERTQFGSEISLLPGSFLLGAPFVLLGNSAFQVVFWLIVFLAVSGVYLRSRASALLLTTVLFILSTAVQYEYISGGDLLANSIFVPVLFLLTVRAFSRPGSPAWSKVLSAVALGIGLASRANFLLLLPLLFAVSAQRAGGRAAAAGIAVVLTTMGGLVLPFYLANADGFPPFTVANKLAQYDVLIHSFSSEAVILTAVGVSLLLAAGLARKPRGDTCVFAAAAVVQFLPVLGAVVLDSLTVGKPDFMILHDRYGLMFLFFAAWASWPLLFRAKAVSSSVSQADSEVLSPA
jgi:hypothetical protein